MFHAYFPCNIPLVGRKKELNLRGFCQSKCLSFVFDELFEKQSTTLMSTAARSELGAGNSSQVCRVGGRIGSGFRT